ncbi:hypothetical protein [Aliikangiella maris]|uniref:Uncharacterized protein n=2 Tax=Aliikangiella maris TaxID=3162458 RepID=A0ABV3MQ88_9GAMM
MKNRFVLGIFIITLSISIRATDYIWSSAMPNEIHIIPDGMELLSEFDVKNLTTQSE